MTDQQELENFVNGLYEGGKKPCEKFGTTHEELGTLMNEIMATSQRRIDLGKRMNEQKLECPNCSTRQVQLVGYMDIVPAQWKCRKCKTNFEWEGI